MNKDQLIHELGAKLVAEMNAKSKDWAQSVLVIDIDDSQFGMSGFLYDGAGKHTPYSPNDVEIGDLAEELRESMASDDDKAPWKSSLIRIDRAKGEIDAEFEYEKMNRWSITFKNTAERAVELKPAKP